MHDTVDFPEQWSMLNNAETRSASISPRAVFPRVSRSEGCLEPSPAVCQPYRVPGAAAAVNHYPGFGPGLQQQSSFGLLLEASGASMTACQRAGSPAARQSPLRSNSPWQSSSLYSPAQLCSSRGTTAEYSSSRGTTAESHPLGCKQLASLEPSLSGDLSAVVPLPPQHFSTSSYSSTPVPASRETTQTHTTGLLHTITQHQLSELGTGAPSTGQLEQPAVPCQEVCCEDVTLADIVPMMMFDDEHHSAEKHEASQVSIPTSGKELPPNSAPLPLAATAGLQGVQSWQDDRGLPKLSHERRSSSAPPAALAAAAEHSKQHASSSGFSASADASVGSKSAAVNRHSGFPASGDASVGSKSAAFITQRTETTMKSAPGRATSRLQLTGNSLEGSSPERTASHTSAWSYKVYAVIERVTSATRRSTGAAPAKDDSGSTEQNAVDHTRHRHSPAQPLQPGGTAVMVLDMGIHKLPGIAEPLQLITVLPPGLEARAHFYPPLCTQQQQTPGYLDAPAAAQSPLVIEAYSRHTQHGYFDPRAAGAMSVAKSIVILPPVLMVFCAVDGYHDMLAANR
eukprot:GHUV01016119.1.p1 GENE.GHUV01016119.1~~GHUV01016119.1.p1  ORF type:complete len:570 (+),score=146.72 GHUV01016119.1:1073-2782(+)